MLYYTVLTEYKEYIVQWHKGTSGGSGLSSKFESWSKEKLDKFDIDPEIYDHTDVAARPSILMEGYTKKNPYLTAIFMWDITLDHILFTKYVPSQDWKRRCWFMHRRRE